MSTSLMRAQRECVEVKLEPKMPRLNRPRAQTYDARSANDVRKHRRQMRPADRNAGHANTSTSGLNVDPQIRKMASLVMCVDRGLNRDETNAKKTKRNLRSIKLAEIIRSEKKELQQCQTKSTLVTL